MSDLSIALSDELVDRIAERVCNLLAERQLAAQQEPERWCSADEAAAFLSKPVSRVYDLAASGAIPSGTDGRSRLFRLSELTAYVTAHRNGGGA